MSDKVSALVEKIKELTLLEASELKTALEKEIWCYSRRTGYDGWWRRSGSSSCQLRKNRI